MSQSVTPREASATVRLADVIIRAGAIYSMAADRKVYRAIAIRDEWIVAVSEDPHGLDGLISAGTQVVDEAGLTIIPSFFDTHNHFIIAARNIGKVPADQAHTIAELVGTHPAAGSAYSAWSVGANVRCLARVQSG